MKFKAFAPWLICLLLLAGLVALFSMNQKQQAELTSARTQLQEMESLRAEVANLKDTHAQKETAELLRLRKDNEDLPRLRNEVRTLREQTRQLSGQVQSAQAQTAQAQNAQAQAQLQADTLRNTAAQAAAQAQQAEAAFRARYGLAPQTPEQMAATCINNLRQIDGAKQQWALENKKTAYDLPANADLTPYLRGGFPQCPAGGAYTLNPVNTAPTCSAAGHVLPR